jgi:hypothetical protein
MTNLVILERRDLTLLEFEDALNGLLEMLPASDDSESTLEARALLCAMRDRYVETMNALRSAHESLTDAATLATDLRIQKDDALQMARSLHATARQRVRQEQLGDIRIEHDLSNNDAAAAILDVLTGSNEAVSTYLRKDLRNVIQKIVADLQENGDL